MKNQPDLLTRSEAAQYLSITVRQLERLASAGTGPTHLKLGYRTVRYGVDALDAWLASRTVVACNALA